jgi:hypothetical protein
MPLCGHTKLADCRHRQMVVPGIVWKHLHRWRWGCGALNPACCRGRARIFHSVMEAAARAGKVSQTAIGIHCQIDIAKFVRRVEDLRCKLASGELEPSADGTVSTNRLLFANTDGALLCTTRAARARQQPFGCMKDYERYNFSIVCCRCTTLCSRAFGQKTLPVCSGKLRSRIPLPRRQQKALRAKLA